MNIALYPTSISQLNRRLVEYSIRWTDAVAGLLWLQGRYQALLEELTPEQKATQAGEWIQEILELDLNELDYSRVPESLDDRYDDD